MPLQYLSGDPLLTRCQTLAIAHNRLGRTEVDPLSTALMRAYPAAYASYGRRCKQNRQASGDLFLWTQSVPQLLFMTVRDSSVGATRLRYVQRCLMTIARDYSQYNIKSLAIAPLGSPQEWEEIKSLLDSLLGNHKLDVMVYEQYETGIRAEDR